MKQVLLIAVGAIVGATLLTLFFLPACMGVVISDYCMPLSSMFIPLLAHLGSEGGAPGVFQSVWLGYFTLLGVLLTGITLARWVRRRRQVEPFLPHYPRLNPSEFTAEDYRALSSAIVLYIQKGSASWPQHDEAAVIKEFGEEKGKILVNQIRSLVREMYEIKVDWEKHTPTSAADFVLDEIKKRFPGLSDEARGALWWKFTFDTK